MATLKKTSSKSTKKVEEKIAVSEEKQDVIDLPTETTMTESDCEESNEQLGQKKRGRKPKSKVNEEEADSQKQLFPKKRGRRPKDKTYTVISNYKEVPNEIEEDNIILHLPVETEASAQNNENDMKILTDGVLRYEPNLCEPLPYEPMDTMKSGFALLSDRMQEKIGEVSELEEKGDKKVGSEVDVRSGGDCGKDSVYLREIGFEEDNTDYFRVLKKVKLLKLIMSEEEKREWDISTENCCFYCTEKFQTVPIGIPVRYYRGKFFCRDNFCSFNCAASYIFSGFDNKYNFKKWEYYSLLCLMASLITKELEENEKNGDITQSDKKKQSVKVKMAEDRNLLKKFGGPLTIEQFRKNFYVLDSNYTLLYPPICCMYPQAEVAHYVNIHRQKAQILNNESRFSFGDSRMQLNDLRLKRDKPLIQKKNTLEEYMSLKINDGV